MIINRELGLEDYLAIGRRRLKIVLLPALVATLIGFLISFALTPKYTSRSLLLVEPQILPTGYVKPIITEQLSERMMTLQQNVLSRSRLQPLVHRLGLVRAGKSEDDVIDRVQANLQITEKKARPRDRSDTAVAGFNVNFTADNPRDAQQVCAEITSLVLAENLEVRQQVAQSTTSFLARQLEQAKQNLDQLDNKLSTFKKLHLGRLPSDEDKNLKIMMGLTSQLDAYTEALSRAQQDKSFNESVLAQEMSAMESFRADPNLPSLRQELLVRENQLVELQSRYTEDHPDVVKLKNTIAELKARLKKMKPDTTDTTSQLSAPETISQTLASDETSQSVVSEAAPLHSAPETTAQTPAEKTRVKLDPPAILRLKAQIHQDDMVIARATREQRRLQDMVNSYQSRLSLSPDVEEQYKQLTRDNQTAHEIYDNLLANKNAAQMQTEMERNQQGEQVKLLDPASFPDSPSSPVRWMFAAGGFGSGLCLGVCVAFWRELQDKSIRNEGDVLAALELPMLATVPWLGADENGKDGKGRFRDRFKPFSGGKRTLEV